MVGINLEAPPSPLTPGKLLGITNPTHTEPPSPHTYVKPIHKISKHCRRTNSAQTMTHQSGTLVTFTSASSSNGCWIFARFGGGIAGGCGGMAFCSGRNERITGPDILPMPRTPKTKSVLCQHSAAAEQLISDGKHAAAESWISNRSGGAYRVFSGRALEPETTGRPKQIAITLPTCCDFQGQFRANTL